jgi:hypothetical protein
MLCSVKGSVHDLSKIFMPKVEGKFHATKVRVTGTKKNSARPKPLPAKTLFKKTLRSLLTGL